MTTFAAVASSLEAKAPDATKHVNYSLGMVLGVDDFNQDFAYLLGRNRWLARDAIGYGTLCGLRVTTESGGSKGPRVRVTSGSALTPRGQLVCVKPDQCAYLNDWLVANKDEVTSLVASPVSDTIDLYLTLCYRDCPVDLVPIPGAPCRTEDELMKPSRLVDDFSLELRTSPPDQSEEDVLRQFVIWLRSLSFGTGSTTTPDDFEQLLRDSVQVVVASPPSSPLSAGATLVFGSPLASVTLDPTLAPEYYRAAFRVWIEDIRPHVHAICACTGGCCGSNENDAPKTDECLLLARIEVPVIFSSGNWHVDETGTIDIDESRRPMLVHLRLLQELITTAGVAAAPAPASAPAGPVVVAAGLIGVDASETPVFGNLFATFDDPSAIRILFDDYDENARYIVKAMARSGVIGNPTIVYDGADASGILLHITNGAADISESRTRALQFMIEISRID